MAVWMIFMPRSPDFLVSKGDMEGAKKSLKWLRGGASADVDEELDEIKKTVEERTKVGSVSITELFTEARYVKPLAIVLVLMALQQLSGINYVLSYSALIFEVIERFFNYFKNFLSISRVLESQLMSAPVQCLLGVFKWLEHLSQLSSLRSLEGKFFLSFLICSFASP